MIYFNAVMGIIGAFQVFAVPYVMTNGGDGPDRSLLFMATYLYQNAFDYWKWAMRVPSVSCSLSWFSR